MVVKNEKWHTSIGCQWPSNNSVDKKLSPVLGITATLTLVFTEIHELLVKLEGQGQSWCISDMFKVITATVNDWYLCVGKMGHLLRLQNSGLMCFPSSLCVDKYFRIYLHVYLGTFVIIFANFCNFFII